MSTVAERSLSLYEVETELIDAAHRAVEEGDETALIILDEYLQQSREKRDKVALALRMFDADISFHKQEIDRLRNRQERLEASREKLEQRVMAVMNQLDITSLDGRMSRMAMVANPPSVEITDADAVPEQFKDIKQQVVIRKSDIAKVLKQGREVPGCDLRIGASHLKVS